MKKLMVGCTLFLGGIIGISSITIPRLLSFNPQDFTSLWLNIIMNNGTILPMLIFLTIFFVGLYIMYKEYKNEE